MLAVSKAAFLTLCLCMGLVTTTTKAEVNLPEMGVPSHTTISPSDEKRLGRAFMRAVSMQTHLFNDQPSLFYLQKLGNQLSQHTSPKHDFFFFMVQDPSINAFAGPGGYVGINTGLVTTAEQEAELAAVLAHEITHVTQRHIARGIEHANESTWPSVGAIVAALLLGGKLDTAVTSGAILTAAASKMQHTINYTRRFECEADRIGMRVLFESGFDPTAMPRFFSRMQHRTLDFNDPSMALLRTHPVTEERIADSQNRARFYPSKPAQINDEFSLIKARVTVITAATRHDVLRQFRQQWLHGNQNPAVRYGYGMALIHNHQQVKAIAIFQNLCKEFPSQPLFKLSLAEAQQAAHINSELKTLEAAQKQFPDYNPLQLAYAESLLEHDKPEQSRQVLLNFEEGNKFNAQYHLLLSEAQGRTNRLIEAYQSRAQGFIILNDLERAVMQLEQAYNLAAHKPRLRHKIGEKIKQLRREIAIISEL